MVASDETRKGYAEVPATENQDDDKTCVVVVTERPRIRMRVIAPGGALVEDAVVLARPEGSEDGEWGAWPYFFSGERGIYTSGPLPPGDCEVTVTPQGWAHRSVRVPLDMAREYEVEVRLKDAHTLRGSVVDDVGRPVAGASVSSEDGSEETDAAGRFVIRGLAGKPVEVVVSCEGHHRIEVAVAPTVLVFPSPSNL